MIEPAPYSPSLAPTNSYHFPEAKELLSGTHHRRCWHQKGVGVGCENHRRRRARHRLPAALRVKREVRAYRERLFEENLVNEDG